MLDREEALKINNLLTKSKLDKELDLDGTVYKKGDTLTLETLLSVNRFAMKKSSIFLS